MPKRDDPQIQFRATPEEKEIIEAAIERSGLTPNVWYRVVTLTAAGQTEIASVIWRASQIGKEIAGEGDPIEAG